MEMDPGALRNFKDFLQLYNKMTEICFARCIDNVNSRTLDQDEVECVEKCSSKFVNFNNKLMQNFVRVQTDIVNKRVEEAEKQNSLNTNNMANMEQNQLENGNSLPIKENQNQLLPNSVLEGRDVGQKEITVSS